MKTFRTKLLLSAVMLMAAVTVTTPASAFTISSVWLNLTERATYTYSGRLFTVEYPEGWKYEETSDRGLGVAIARFNYPSIFGSDNAQLRIDVVDRGQKIGEMTPAVMADRIAAIMKDRYRNYDGYVAGNPKQITQNKVGMAFIYLDNDTLMSGEAYIERHDRFNAISLITLHFPADQYDENNAQAAQEIFSSLRLRKSYPATGVQRSNAGFRVEIQKAGYERWGRPEVMDNPQFSGTCTGDDKRPVLKLGISLAIHNTGRTDWPAGSQDIQFYKPDGTPAAWCWYDYMGVNMPTKAGNAWVASYTVFVEQGERVGYGVFRVRGVGDVRFEVPQNLPMP